MFECLYRKRIYKHSKLLVEKSALNHKYKLERKMTRQQVIINHMIIEESIWDLFFETSSQTVKSQSTWINTCFLGFGKLNSCSFEMFHEIPSI